MEKYPVWDLFRSVGQVQVEEEGLYLVYSAEIQSERQGFHRLYHSKNGIVTRLGLFLREESVQACEGRVSLRSLGIQWQDGTFTIRNVPFSPLKTPLHGGYIPEKAILLQEKGRRYVVISHENSLPEGIMPYFCFLAPMEIDGTKCLGFEVDSSEKPVIFKVIPQ